MNANEKMVADSSMVNNREEFIEQHENIQSDIHQILGEAELNRMEFIRDERVNLVNQRPHEGDIESPELEDEIGSNNDCEEHLPEDAHVISLGNI